MCRGGTRKREDADTSIGIDPGDFWKEDVSCEGQETTLDDCVFSGTSDTRCIHGYDDIYVTCRPNTGTCQKCHKTCCIVFMNDIFYV